MSGTHLNFTVFTQLPILPPNSYKDCDAEYVSQRVLELSYTSEKLKVLAQDMGFEGPPFKWDETQRVQIRAELDAYFAHLYGISREELRYVLDPQQVFGIDFPGETFRVLKEKEQKSFGEYRTPKLVLAAFDALSASDRFRGERRECTITRKVWATDI